MNPNDPPLSFELKRSSWENIFRVLKWCAPMSCENEKGYRAQEGEFFSLGGFWAQVQHLQAQMAEHKRITELYAAEWPPLSDDDAGKLLRPCGLCGEMFREGDLICQLEIGPADVEDVDKKRRGKVYDAACDVVHKRCYEKAAGMVRYVEEKGS